MFSDVETSPEVRARWCTMVVFPINQSWAYGETTPFKIHGIWTSPTCDRGPWRPQVISGKSENTSWILISHACDMLVNLTDFTTSYIAFLLLVWCLCFPLCLSVFLQLSVPTTTGLKGVSGEHSRAICWPQGTLTVPAVICNVHSAFFISLRLLHLTHKHWSLDCVCCFRWQDIPPTANFSYEFINYSFPLRLKFIRKG